MGSKTTASAVIAAAKSHISKAPYQRPNKFTVWFSAKYGQAYKTAPWCGIFVDYVIENDCKDQTLLKGLGAQVAAVGYIYSWAQRNGYIKYSGKKGDLVIFDWTCGNGIANSDHVGFFVKDNGNGTVTTIEGNTSNTSDGNGNCVQQRVRDKKWIRCYVRLPYKTERTQATSKAKAAAGYAGTYPTATISVQVGTSANIKLWQKYLNWYGNYQLKVDGIYGTMTYKATKTFQAENGLDIDGICGQKTIAKAKTIKK